MNIDEPENAECKIADTTCKTIDSTPVWKKELTGLYPNNSERCSPR